MKLVQTVIVILALLTGGAASAAKKQPDYTGEDGGYLVYSVGTIAIGMNFTFPYQRVALENGDKAEDWEGFIEPTTGGMWTLKIKNPDFTGRESGHIIVRRLPPGQYAVQNFAFSGQSALGGAVHWSSKKQFSLPFEVKSNQTTYIGSFMRAPSLGTALQPVLGAAGFFVISDKAERDMPLARGKQPLLGEVSIQVTDVSRFGSAALQSREPE